MTLDQVWFRLCDLTVFKGKVGERTTKVTPLNVPPNKDGVITGKAADGSVIKGVVRGKSKARQAMEAAEEKRRQEALSSPRKKRNRK